MYKVASPAPSPDEDSLAQRITVSDWIELVEVSTDADTGDLEPFLHCNGTRVNETDWPHDQGKDGRTTFASRESSLVASGHGPMLRKTGKERDGRKENPQRRPMRKDSYVQTATVASVSPTCWTQYTLIEPLAWCKPHPYATLPTRPSFDQHCHLLKHLVGCVPSSARLLPKTGAAQPKQKKSCQKRYNKPHGLAAMGLPVVGGTESQRRASQPTSDTATSSWTPWKSISPS